MLYVKNISTPKSTTEPNAVKTKLKVWRGVIHSMEIQIPPGHAGLGHVQIFIGAHQIMPTNNEENISGDGEIVPGKFFIDLKKGINILTIKTWNDDDTFAHRFIVRVGVLPKFVLIPVGAAEGILSSLKSLVIRPQIIRETEDFREWS